MNGMADSGEPSATRMRTRAHARATVDTAPLWRTRLARELPRLLLMGASCAGLLACARYAIAPPRPPVPARVQPGGAPTRDLAAEGFAQLFARRYLTWKANAPEAHRQGLGSFVGSGLEPDAGLQPPPGGQEQVQWTEVVQERISSSSSSSSSSLPPGGERVYTVAAQTDTSGLVYLAVGVVRGPGGALRLAGYPAFVGAPASGPAIAAAAGTGREVSDPALRTVVERALRNYLAGAGAELAADLTRGARVSLPTQSLSLAAVQRLDWSSDGAGAIGATVQAEDGRGASYTLAYELDVAEAAGRWEVAAIEMDPDA